MLVSALDEVVWLLNLRGGDVEFNPVVISYAGKNIVPFFSKKNIVCACIYLLCADLSFLVSASHAPQPHHSHSGDPRGRRALRRPQQALGGGDAGKYFICMCVRILRMYVCVLI